MFLGRHTCLPFLARAGGFRDVPLLAELGGVPPFVIVVGDRRRAWRVLSCLDEPTDLCARTRALHGQRAAGRVEIGVGLTQGVPVMVVETQMGGPATQIIVREVLDESFHPGGAQAVIRVGSCGTLSTSAAPPELVVAAFASGWSSAVEQEVHGVGARPTEFDATAPADPPVIPADPGIVRALEAGAAEAAPGASCCTAGVFSKDSLYSEQDAEFAGVLKRLGCLATEMEVATIAPLASVLGVPWGGIMATAGGVPDGPWFEAEQIEASEDQAIAASLAAIRHLAEDRDSS